MKRALIFVGLIAVLFTVLCFGQVVITPSGGSGTLTSSQFNANQFSVTAGGVVYGEKAGRWTNELFVVDTAVNNVGVTVTNPTTTIGAAGLVLDSKNGGFIGFNTNGAAEWYIGNDTTGYWGINRDSQSPAVRVNLDDSVALKSHVTVGGNQTNSGTFQAAGAAIGANSTNNGVYSMAVGYKAVIPSGAYSRFLFASDIDPDLPITNTVDESFMIYTPQPTYTYAPFTVLTNAPAFTAWTTNQRQMTVEANFLLTPAVAQPAAVTLTVEKAGAFTNVWQLTAPANLAAHTVGMTHRITKGARFKFTDTSGSGATAAFVAQAYAEVYE